MSTCTTVQERSGRSMRIKKGIRAATQRIALSVLSAMVGVYLACCSTPYKSYGVMGGYSDQWVGPRVFAVGFNGNGFTSLHQVRTYALFRCAELTLEQGYTHFVILKGNSGSTTSVGYVAPTQYSYGYTFPVTTFANLLYIRLMCPAEASTIRAYDAKKTFQSLRPTVSPGRKVPRPDTFFECSHESDSFVPVAQAGPPTLSNESPRSSCKMSCRSEAEACAARCISMYADHVDAMVSACQGECRISLGACQSRCAPDEASTGDVAGSFENPVKGALILPQHRPATTTDNNGDEIAVTAETGIVIAASDEVVVVDTLFGKKIFKARTFCSPEFMEGEVVKFEQSSTVCVSNRLTSTTTLTACDVWCE